MSKKTAAKRALFFSLVSMLLCISMLVGSTYAWFTDTETSAANIILAGTLDVALYHANEGTDGTDEKVTSSTPLFTDVDSQKWEPGAMAWEKFTVKNEGDLALKFEFALNATNATVIEGISFAKMLKIAVVDDSFVYTRENVNQIAESRWMDIDSFEPIASSASGLVPDQKDTFGVIIWWKPSANDNLFNNSNGDASIDIGVVLNAIQSAHEEDSFDANYDSNAVFPAMSENVTIVSDFSNVYKQ